MADTGATLAGTAASVPIASKPNWTFPDYAKLDNSSFAICISIASQNYGDYLRLTNFGFSVPGGATIDGIYVEVQRLCTTVTRMQDYELWLVKDGVHKGDDQADPSYWATSEESVYYGGAADKCGWTDVTPADVNDSGFGIDISAFNDDNSTPRTAQIDCIKVTIYYTEAPTAHRRGSFFKMF